MKEILTIVALKQDVQFAYQCFKDKYGKKVTSKVKDDSNKISNKKVSKGIKELYDKIMLSNDLAEIKRLYSKFYGYLLKSKNAKEKWK